MCVDFIDYNATCVKDLYLMHNINHVIEESSGYKMLSIMDAYSRYNHIKMDHMDAPKKIFMSNPGNYYYKVTPFGLKNPDLTYLILMDALFSN